MKFLVEKRAWGWGWGERKLEIWWVKTETIVVAETKMIVGQRASSWLWVVDRNGNGCGSPAKTVETHELVGCRWKQWDASKSWPPTEMMWGYVAIVGCRWKEKCFNLGRGRKLLCIVAGRNRRAWVVGEMLLGLSSVEMGACHRRSKETRRHGVEWWRLGMGFGRGLSWEVEGKGKIKKK